MSALSFTPSNFDSDNMANMTDVKPESNLTTELCGVQLKSPLIAASGTFGCGMEYDELYDITCWGAISVKGMTLHPREGNPPHRIAETASGMLNSIGLQNPGVDTFIRRELPWLKERGVVVIANLAGSDINEYEEAAARLADSDIDMLELNISCQSLCYNTRSDLGAVPDTAGAVVSAVRRVLKGKPLIVKLSPNVIDIIAIARAVEDAGADGVSLINTINGMAVDLKTRRPILANVTGGLSGPAIKPIALRMVWLVAQSVKIPVIGAGGIMTGHDAAEFLMVGASAVMIGTANLMDPMSGPRIRRELSETFDELGVRTLKDLVGTLRA